VDANEALGVVLAIILLMLACAWLCCMAGACGAATW